MAGITGEGLHGIFREADAELTTPWNGLTPYDKMVYETVATALNGTYLAPLPTLVRDYQTLQQETFDAFYQNAGSPEELSTKMSQLEERTKELLNAEQKEG